MTNVYFKDARHLPNGQFSWSPEGKTTQAADVLAVPITHSFVTKSLGADAEAMTLENGMPGQKLTVYLGTQASGGAGTITPVTATGWATAILDDVGDTVAFEYKDHTVGWTIEGAFGLTAQPQIT